MTTQNNNNAYKFHLLSTEGLIIKNPETEIKYKTSDNKEFTHRLLAQMHQEEIDAKDYYNMLLTKRNWLQRTFNIKPSMNFYYKMKYGY